jgi:hypothetical protein
MPHSIRLYTDLPYHSLKRTGKRQKSSNDILDHMTVDIGEAKITALVAVSQLAMVYT